MKKRTHYELLAAANRAEMRHHALSWRASKCDPYAAQLFKERHEESIATSLDCAKSYRNFARDYDKMALQEAQDALALALHGPDRVLLNGDPVICPGCKREIDPHTCYCGGRIPEDSHEGHKATPIGCRCGYPKEEKEEAPF